MAWKFELFDIFFVQKWSVLSYLFCFEYCTLFKSKHYEKYKSIGKFKALMLAIKLKELWNNHRAAPFLVDSRRAHPFYQIKNVRAPRIYRE